MNRKLLLIVALVGVASQAVFARARVNAVCMQGNQTITVAGTTSSAATPVQRSYPACVVTVYITGSGGTKASIYSDNSGTVLANPFTVGTSPETATNGNYFFYADNGRYDVQMSAGGIPSPFTVGDVQLFDPANFLPPACGSNDWVQYSLSGVLGCSANFQYDPTAQELILQGTGSSNIGLTLNNGIIQATAGGFLSTAAGSTGFQSNSDGASLRGYKTAQNTNNLNGGYFQFAPITYNPYDGGMCVDVDGNPVQQPLPLTGGSFGTHDTIMWVGTSPLMPTNGSCGAPLPIEEDYGLNMNSYLFARGGLATDNLKYNAINTIYQGNGNASGGVTAGSVTAGTLYPAGTMTTTGMLSVPTYLGGYIQTGFSNGVPAVGTIATVTNPLTAGDGIEAGTLYYDTSLNCFNGYSGTSWSCLGTGGGTPGGLTSNIQFNFLGAFSGTNNFTYVAGTPNQVTLTGVYAANGANAGFDASTATATNAIQAPLGGLYGKWSTVSDSTFWLEEGAPAVTSSAQAKVYADSTAHTLKWSQNGSNFYTMPTIFGAVTLGDCVNFTTTLGFPQITDSGSPCGGGGGSGTVTSSAQYNIAYYTSTGTTVGGNAAFAWNPATPQVSLAGNFQTNGAAYGFNASTCTAFNCFQAPSTGGGMYAFRYAFSEMAAPSLSSSGNAVIYLDSTQKVLNASIEGGAFLHMVTASGTITPGNCAQFSSGSPYGDVVDAGAPCGSGGGSGTVSNCASTGGVAYYASTGTTVSCSAGFLWNPGTPQVSVAGTVQTNGTSYGFNASTCTLWNCIQASSGGGGAKSFTAQTYIQPGVSSGTPTVTSGDTFHSGTHYWDTTIGAGAIEMYQATGSCWFAAGGAAVTVNGSSCGSTPGVNILYASGSGGSVEVYNSSAVLTDTLDQTGLVIGQTTGSNAIFAQGAWAAGGAASLSNTSTSSLAYGLDLLSDGGASLILTQGGASTVGVRMLTSASAILNVSAITGAPSGSCTNGSLGIRTDGAATGSIGYYCYSTSWHAIF